MILIEVGSSHFLFAHNETSLQNVQKINNPGVGTLNYYYSKRNWGWVKLF